MRKRLYLQIYLALVSALILFAIAASALWWLAPRDRDADMFMDGIAQLVADAIPPSDQSVEAQTAALRRMATQFGANLTLLGAEGTPIANVGPVLSARWMPWQGSGMAPSHGQGMVAVLALPDGRKLLAKEAHHHRHPPLAALVVLALLTGAIALAALPVARRLTRRLERLQVGVERLGQGDLHARVQAEGRDEIATLANSFNHAAERIERLVHAQKDALATASHELRSPLARMRVAIELLGDNARPDVLERIADDIEELDELIGEILLTSRLDASPVALRNDEVDLLALVAEEGARVGAEVAGEPVVVRGDARLLRRLARNLFENARRYGDGSPIDAEVVAATDATAVLRVSDRGKGIPEEERERVFEAFYRRAGTSEGAGGGVGLGLALVRRIATSHGGTAKALPREGGGATLEVVIARG